MTGYPKLDQLGRKQYGLVTAAQFRQVGMTKREIAALTEAGRVASIRRGIYRLCGVPPSWQTSALAAVLAAGEGAVLSHRSAAVLWGLLDRHHETGRLEITASHQGRFTGVTVHRHRITPPERTRRDGIPVTTPERTLLDLAESIRDPRQLGGLCDEALRRRLLTVDNLHATVRAHRGPGRRRLAPIHAVLADRVPGYDPGANDWEQRMDRLWDRLGLPAAERQYRVRLGRRSYRLDRAIVDLKIAIEWNGLDPHAYRTQLHQDSQRRAELAAAGWRVLDFTTRSRPEVICGAVEAAVTERRRLLAKDAG
jgi:very-short-patch-repair endonuclease